MKNTVLVKSGDLVEVLIEVTTAHLSLAIVSGGEIVGAHSTLGTVRAVVGTVVDITSLSVVGTRLRRRVTLNTFFLYVDLRVVE